MRLEGIKFKALAKRFATVACGCFLSLWSLGYVASAPNTAHKLTVQIVPQFNSKSLVFDNVSFTNAMGQSVSVTRADFLVSDFALHRKDGGWIEQTNCQAYISLHEKRSSFNAENLAAGNYDRIRFHVGLKPELNHSNPAKYAPEHPLNPNLNGMHWGWTGGYVFFAIEGRWRTEEGKLSGYSFHLGNDAMLMTVEVPVVLDLNKDQSLALALNLDQLFAARLTGASSSTHSRAGDDLAASLRKGVEHAFSVVNTKGGAGETIASVASTHSPAPMLVAPKATPYRFAISAQFPIPELPRDNPLTEEGVELGHRLFGEKLLSINGQQSCATCHRAEAAFADPGKRVNLGAEGQVGTRNAMPIYNLAWKKSFFWDGRAPSLREQVLMPIQNPIEMHETLDRVVAKLAKTKFYPSAFEKAFGSREINSDRIARALEQFVLSQVSFDSKFDRALDGKETLTDEEKRGFELFMTEYDPRHGQYGADCFHCHGGPFFTTHGFANNGLDSKFKDLGRSVVTKAEADQGKFAVPSLRNVELTGPYMHDGRFKTLEEVVDHYCTGMKRTTTLDPNLAKHPDGGVPLSVEDRKALVAFLKTLTEEDLKQGRVQFTLK
ncbi:MAG: hypothetical protein JWQ71_3041 [Pedosphaera sp.]|nr:hypothetical protein [Pedosphaera sp.]